ncbi:MAG: homocysteine S-methyltransferase family protein [Deltaproteobacteria bacterium]|nr:homocysteine S-methyltransferase family protein [Deltaproteobacteria bacterium]
MLSTLRARFTRGPLLLDGPTGTELERRGHATTLPLWTALAVRDAKPILRSIHEDYARAGADILTACTFRTSRHVLDKCGRGEEAAALTREAVALARDVAEGVQNHEVLVAGSIAPLEDCYHPERTPDHACLEREHALHADNLARSGVNLLLVETMPTSREAVHAAKAATSTGLPVIVSLLAGPDATLFDSSPLLEAIDALSRLPIVALSVNCAPPAWCSRALDVLRSSGLPFGAYANSSIPDGSFGDQPEPLGVRDYAAAAGEWLAQGARLIGGCCGTMPAHIAALRALIDRAAPEAA